MTVQFGQYPEPAHTIAHLSDTHLLSRGRLQYGKVQPEDGLREVLRRLPLLDPAPQAIVITGDLADYGEPEAYRRLKELVEESAAALGLQVVWVMGNHDIREHYAAELLGITGEAGLRPQDAVHHLGGLRIISLDSSVPGFHHGVIEPEQLDWLRAELATPAPDGTVLALHHPPQPLPMERVSQLIELEGQAELAEVLRGTDVRVILAGHMHYASYSTFAGIPVCTGSASCYTMDVASAFGMRGLDANQAFSMLHLYRAGDAGLPEATFTHTVVPLTDGEELTVVTREQEAQLAAAPAEMRHQVVRPKHFGVDGQY